MSYPEPFAKSTIERKINELGLSDQKLNFLEGFFKACANLYGSLEICEMWEIYKRLTNVPNVRRKDLIEFAKIMRRRENPYYIYEVSELYSEEKDDDLNLTLVSNILVRKGYGKFYLFYELMEFRDGSSYYIPDDILDYVDPRPIQEEVRLYHYLSQLKSTEEFIPRHGTEVIKNPNRGKMLNEFSFLNDFEEFAIEMAKREWEKEEFKNDARGTLVEKVIRQLKEKFLIGHWELDDSVEKLFKELNDAGVELNENEVAEIADLVLDYYNHSNLWWLNGWSPEEFMVLMGFDEIEESVFLDIEERILNGEISEEEFIEFLESMDFEDED